MLWLFFIIILTGDQKAERNFGFLAKIHLSKVPIAMEK